MSSAQIATREVPPYLPAWVNADAELVSRGRRVSATFLLEVGDVSWLVRIERGRVERVERGPFAMRPWTFAIRAPEASWQSFWETVPPPGFHDLFALTRFGGARIEGDPLPLMQHLRYVKDVLASPRGRR